MIYDLLAKAAYDDQCHLILLRLCTSSKMCKLD